MKNRRTDAYLLQEVEALSRLVEGQGKPRERMRSIVGTMRRTLEARAASLAGQRERKEIERHRKYREGAKAAGAASL